MAIPHAEPGQMIDATPLGARLAETKTHTLVKTDEIEMIRLVLPAGKELPTHKAPGTIIVQCLEGRVLFTARDDELDMFPGNLVYLTTNEPHAVLAVEDSSVLLTIIKSSGLRPPTDIIHAVG